MNEIDTHQFAAPHANAWAVYLLECVDGRVYTGIARDPEQRYAQHSAGKGARFTRANPPRALLGWVWVDSRRAALKLEIAWKRLPRAERIAALRTIPKTGQSQKRGPPHSEPFSR